MRRLTVIAYFFHLTKVILSFFLFFISLTVYANTTNNNYLNNKVISKYNVINHSELDNQKLTGYRGDYPMLAKSMLLEDSIFSMVAMQYFRAVLFEHQIILTAEQLKQMQLDMAKGYLEFVEREFKKGKSSISGDITFEGVSRLHKKVYAKYKIPFEAWILKPIFDELSENEREEYWLKILDSTGSMHKEFAFSHLIMTKMIEKLKHAPASKQENLYKVLRRISHTTVFSKFSTVAREFIIASMESMENKRK